MLPSAAIFFCDLVDKFDDPLCAEIGGRALGAEQKDRRLEIRKFPVFEFFVNFQDRKGRHQLTLVLVQALDLCIDNGIGQETDPLFAENIFRKLFLLFLP